MTIAQMPAAPMNRLPGVKADISPKALKSWNPDLSPRAEAVGENSISILGPIGEYYSDGVTPKRIEAALRSIGDKPVDVYLNSPGGDVFAGLAIYSLFLQHPQPVTVKVLGVAASAASVIAMAATDVKIMRSAFLMIHNTWVVAAGDRNAFKDVAAWLAPFDEALADIYVARTGIAGTEISALMDKETWISGSSAVEQGFADTFIESGDVELSAQNDAQISPSAAAKKADLLMQRGDAPRSMRRELLSALKKGMPSAASEGKSSAAQPANTAEQLLALLQTSTS